MARSAPRLKRLMPAMSRIAPIAKTVSSLWLISTHGVMERTNTSTLTGITETSDSLSFWPRDLLNSFNTEEKASAMLQR